MNKFILFMALLLVVCGAGFLYFNHDDKAGVIDGVEIKETQISDKKRLPVLNTAPAIGSNVSETVRQNTIKAPILPPSVPTDANSQLPQVTEPERIEPKATSELESESVPEPVDDDGVPDSYPIEEAELYFVPPEDRYPGNIGGPPPLNLPDPDFEPVIEEAISSPALPGNR